MRKISIIILLISISCLVYSQESETFIKLSDEIGFTFQLPHGYEYMPLSEQKDVRYNIGFKKPTVDEEYRVAAYPMNWLPKDLPPLTNKDELKKMISVMTYTIGLNICQKDDLEFKIYYFDECEVWNEFGGNIGTTFFVCGDSEFSKGYKHVSINCIYREGRGMLVVYVLFNNIEDYIKRTKSLENKEAFYCVKFK